MKMKMNMDGSVRAKCLQYKKNGNELTEKWQTLHKFADGVYYSDGISDWNREPENTVFFECKSVFWCAGYIHPVNMDKMREEIENMRINFFDQVRADAEGGKFINSLKIEVFRRLGHDVSQLLTARSEYLKKREEEEQIKRERKEREIAKQKAREKAEKIADGEKKMLEKCGEVDAKAVELIAAKYGVSIHGRTLGMMREKGVTVVYKDGKTYFRGYKLTRANADSLGVIIDEILGKIAA